MKKPAWNGDHAWIVIRLMRQYSTRPPPSTTVDWGQALHVRGDALRDDRRVGDRELQLVRDERLAHARLQQVDLAGGCVVRDAEVADFAGCLELVERTGDLVGFDEGVGGAVQEEDVEVVGAERLERTLDGSMRCSYE